MIVGVDIGSQTLKVAVLDSALRIRGRSARSYPISHPRPSWVEQDPRLWEAALGPAIAEALTSAGAEARTVQAIGFCGQLDGCIAVDAAGDPLSPCLTWLDPRATTKTAEAPPETPRSNVPA